MYVSSCLLRDAIKIDFPFISGTCLEQGGGGGVSEVDHSRTFSEKKFQNRRGGGKFSNWNLQKKLIPEKQWGRSTLSGQVLDINGKSILMASLTCISKSFIFLLLDLL